MLTHPANSSWRSKLEVVGLENEVYVAPKVDSLSVRQGKQMVVVQDGVEGLDPLGVDISIANQPRFYLSKGLLRLSAADSTRNVSSRRRSTTGFKARFASYRPSDALQELSRQQY